MTTITNLPPQAYTRDTLVKAIEWLSSQPQSVRERATSADLIVSFYLQARRRMTAAQMEAPVSGENFKQDLKHLAQDLKQFEDPSAPPHTQAQPSRALSHGHFEWPQEVEPQPPPTPIHHAPPPPPRPAPVEHKGPTWSIDPRSLAAAREVQQRLNLSNEGEAIRLLVTFGYERARELFP